MVPPPIGRDRESDMLRHRRNNVAAGLLVLSGAVLLVFGAFLPLLTFELPEIGLNVGVTELAFQYQQELVPAELHILLMPLGLVLGILALFLTATRVRGLGTLWRLGSFICFALAAVLTLYCWNIVAGNPFGLGDSPEVSGGGASDQFGAFFQSVFQNSGIITINPGTGLYAISLGTVLTLFGCCIPAIKRTEVVHPRMNHPSTHPNQVAVAPPRAVRAIQETPAGWYRVEGGYRYWDGERWSDEFSPDAAP